MPGSDSHAGKERQHCTLEAPKKCCVRVPSCDLEFRAERIVFEFTFSQTYLCISRMALDQVNSERGLRRVSWTIDASTFVPLKSGYSV